MPTDWTQKINDTFEALGLYPDVEAFDISDMRGHIVVVDTQETTVYVSAEGCYRLIAGVEAGEDEHETFDRIGQALHPNRVEGVYVIEDSGLWRQDPIRPINEER